MKKTINLIILSIISIFIGTISVIAENIIVDNFSVSSKSSTTNVSSITFDNSNLNSNVEFNELNDYIIFNLDISVDDGDTWTVKSVTDDLSNSNITTEYTFTDTTSPIEIKISYTTKATSVITIDSFNINIVLEKEKDDETGTIETEISVNPTTIDNIDKFIVVSFISLIVIILLSRYKKKVFIPLIVLFVFIPSIIFASNVVSINTTLSFSKITINVKEYTVTFDSNGGSSVDPQTVVDGTLATKPSDPTWLRHGFIEWMDEDGSTFDFNTPIEKDITLSANWEVYYAYLEDGSTIWAKIIGANTYNTICLFGDCRDTLEELLDYYGYSTWEDLANDIFGDPEYTFEDALNDDYVYYIPVTSINFKKFLRSDILPDDFVPTGDNTISTSESPYPVYLFAENKIVYYYSDAEILYLNSDSNGMFYNFRAVEEIDLSYFYVNGPTEMNNMFMSNYDLKTVDISNIDFTQVTSMDSMFTDDVALKTIYSNNTTKLENAVNYNMFINCHALVGGAGTAHDAVYSGSDRAIVDGGASNPGYFTSK